MEVSDILDAIPSIRTVVVGEAMLDVYLEGTCRRVCQEAPVPAVAIAARSDRPGGAANVAANVAAVGSAVTCLSVIGEDAESGLLLHAMRKAGVRTDHLLCSSGRRTLARTRVVADGQILLRFDQGDGSTIGHDVEQAIIARLGLLFQQCDLVIVSDYGYGVLTPAVIAALAALQSQAPRFIVADSKNLRRYRNVGVTAVKPNRTQSARLLGGDDGPLPDAGEILAAEHRLLEAIDAEIIAVTLDCEGAVLFERSRPPHRTIAEPAPNSRAIGAGDTFLALLGLALAAGSDARTAADIAAAGSRVVMRKHATAVCRYEELRDELLGHRTLASELIYRPKQP